MNEDELDLTLDDLDFPEQDATENQETPTPTYVTAEDLSQKFDAFAASITDAIKGIVPQVRPSANDDDDDDVYVTKADLKKSREAGVMDTLQMLAPHLGPMLTRNRVDEVAAKHGISPEDVQARLNAMPENIRMEVLNHDGYWADQKTILTKFSPSRSQDSPGGGNPSVERIIKSLKLSPEKATEFRKNAAKAVRDGYVA